MVPQNYLEALLFLTILIVVIPPIGRYMAAVFNGEPHFLRKGLGWLERWTYTVTGIESQQEMDWRQYLAALLWFNSIGFSFLFILLLLQGLLPLNPQNWHGLDWELALNTAISFVTNTNWQAYAGETTLSYLSQTLGLAVQNFLSAATGLGASLALIRGLRAQSSTLLGNYWVDVTRAVVYILMPFALLFACVLVSQGVVQSFLPYETLTTLEGETQTVPLGPVASQEAIKLLGSNGGGFFNANSAHPFENPTPLTDFLGMLAILLLPASLVYMYGTMLRMPLQGWVILGVMFILWSGSLVFMQLTEASANPLVSAYPNYEGKELRFGIFNSVNWSSATTATSNGSVNNMHSSLMPLSGGTALLNMLLEELIFGGVGVGLCSMLMFVLLTVFIAGLMVGRTPEFLGKKIGRTEIIWVMVALLTPSFLSLVGTSVAVTTEMGLTGLGSGGPHGFTEVLYAFASTAGNNGSAFGSLNANTPFYNLSLAFVMLFGRLSIIVPSLALAGHLAAKNASPISIGTVCTDHWLFGFLLIAVILVVGALAFFPALVLGPVMEHLLMLQGYSF
jgi:K+-transporting ATPase ATPase A chain